MFTPKITVGNLMTILTVVISVVSLIRAWSKDRKHKQSESAGRIRQRAGLVIAKIERFRDISSSLFDELQVTITEADAKLARGTDVIETRDFFWKELWVLRRAVSRRIIDEQIQIAYADLYGYDHRVHKLYVGAIRRLETIDDLIFQMLLNETQSNILSLDRLSTEIETTFHSAQLGNLLRTICARIENVFRASMDKVVEAFRKEFARLLEATDLEIMKRRVSLGNPDDLVPSME